MIARRASCHLPGKLKSAIPQAVQFEISAGGRENAAKIDGLRHADLQNM
jgi:hypothetical protein